MSLVRAERDFASPNMTLRHAKQKEGPRWNGWGVC